MIHKQLHKPKPSTFFYILSNQQAQKEQKNSWKLSNLEISISFMEQCVSFEEFLNFLGVQYRQMNCGKKVHMVKGISNLKAHLDYSEDLAQSCENLNFCFVVPKKNCSTD